MKKNGFTLAEVLITLAIIGVVATMTLPALMTNTQEQQAKTGLKKAINTLTEAATMNEAIDGTNFASLTNYGNVKEDASAEINNNSLFGLLDARTAVDYGKTKGDDTIPLNAATVIANPQTVYLRDGSAIIIPAQGAIPATAANNRGDNLPLGYVVVYDTNGAKGPNILSNCMSSANGERPDAATEPAENEADLDEIPTVNCTKAQRVIRDQFQLRLRGTTVQPEGAASAWALNN